MTIGARDVNNAAPQDNRGRRKWAACWSTRDCVAIVLCKRKIMPPARPMRRTYVMMRQEG
ncbi:hypothetical protein K523DRAFT_326115 [Schizophyllum commune Tattone D]|nr:hypothetical protein K523DRAFT_326115 [Schizophyllum commune Tattone D]